MQKLQDWFNANEQDNNLIYKRAGADQMVFVRDMLGCSLLKSDVFVVSTHTSKSVRLAVYSIERPDIGLRVVMRNNFYNWKLSVMSERPIAADFEGLFHTTPPIEPAYTGNPLSPVYFEGFPPELVFGYYEPSDKRQWSADIGGDHTLFTTLFLILKSLDAVKPYFWHTKESHRLAIESMR